MSQCLNPDCLHRNPSKEQFCERCGTKLLLRERYRAIKPLSAGGFGKTFVAIDEDKPSRSYCVIKQFFPKAQDRFSLEKGSVLFEREAKQLDELGQHPQIPELLAYFTDGDYKYLIQEYISGIELKREQEKFGVFDEKKLLAFLYEILLILKFIHARHIIHRDIKPENIIRRSRDHKLVLVDFGAVKDLKGPPTVAPACTIIGSSGYAAPEQWQGKATIASDLYSVGATSVYLLTGVQPSELFDHVQNQWSWQKKLGHNRISDGLSQILDQLLALPLSQRYGSVDEVLADCQALDPTFSDFLNTADLAMVTVAARDSQETIEQELLVLDQGADEDLKPFSFLNEDEEAFWPFNDTEGSEIETSFSANLAEEQALFPKIGTRHPTLHKLFQGCQVLNPTLKKLLSNYNPEYIQVEIQVNSAFKVIEHSDQAGRFATLPELIQVGSDARQGFPELVGLEKIAMEITQGQRQSLQLKEISRAQSSHTLDFDLYFTCDPGQFPSDNRLIILIIEATEALAEVEKINVFPSRLPMNHYSQQSVLHQLDPLTSLASRNAFDAYLHKEWRYRQRQQQSLALIVCELDYFQHYHETYSHFAGDECLSKAARILQAVVRRPVDMIARFAEEQFALILPDTDCEEALSVAESMGQELATANIPHQGTPRTILTLSCGVAALVPTADLTPQTLIQNADRALQEAKAQGRDRAVLFQH